MFFLQWVFITCIFRYISIKKDNHKPTNLGIKANILKNLRHKKFKKPVSNYKIYKILIFLH